MLINGLKKRLLKEITAWLKDFNGHDVASAGGTGAESSSSAIKVNLQSISLGEPKNKNFGDLSTNAAMVLAPVLKKSPMQVAEILSEQVIKKWEEASVVSIAAPGFINFTLNTSYLMKAISVIAEEFTKYGRNLNGKGKKVQVEFVSANPTGNLHIGHGRWAALGDSLSNIFAANGYEVCREYYVNDFGSQIAKFAWCIYSLYLKAFGKEVPYPEDGYPEELVKTVVDEIISENKESYLKDSPVAAGQDDYPADVAAIGRRGIEIMIKRIQHTLSSMGVEFDVWFYESSLYEGENFEKIVESLKQKGVIYEKDSAFWFKALQFGDEKDRVVIRSSGEPTYFASDIIYLLNKVRRGFDRLIYILGADHHGYIKRLHAIGRATGFDDENIEVIIGQLVHLVENGKTVKMSKRRGRVYMLDDLIEEVGKDAVRYFFSANSFDTPMEFDLNLAKQKSNQNPVYYVQYAHARIANIIEKVKNSYITGELKFEKDSMTLPGNWQSLTIKAESSKNKGPDYVAGIKNTSNSPADESVEIFEQVFDFLISNNRFDDIKIKNDDEAGLAKILILYPDAVSDACNNEAPYMINQYLYRLASQFHYFYKHHRIIDEGRLNIARFKLLLLVRVVLSNAMRLLKISTPVKM